MNRCIAWRLQLLHHPQSLVHTLRFDEQALAVYLVNEQSFVRLHQTCRLRRSVAINHHAIQIADGLLTLDLGMPFL